MPDRPVPAYRSPLLVAVYVPTLLLAFAEGLLIAILPLYAAGFGVGYGLVGFASSAAAIGTLLTDVPAGAVLGRVGLRPTMIAGSGLVALSTLGLVWSDQFPGLVLLRFLAGIGIALWALSRHAYIAEAIAPAQRGQALSIFGGINRLGIFGGPAIGGVLADQAGIHATFGLSAALAGLALAMSAILLKPLPQGRDVAAGVASLASGGGRCAPQRARPVGGGDRADARPDDPRRALPDHPALGSGAARARRGADRHDRHRGRHPRRLDVHPGRHADGPLRTQGRRRAELRADGPWHRADPLHARFPDAAAGGDADRAGQRAGLRSDDDAGRRPRAAGGHRRVPRHLAADRRRRGGDGPLVVGAVAAAVGLSGGAWVLSVAGWLAVFTLARLVRETRVGPLDERG